MNVVVDLIDLWTKRRITERKRKIKRICFSAFFSFQRKIPFLFLFCVILLLGQLLSFLVKKKKNLERNEGFPAMIKLVKETNKIFGKERKKEEKRKQKKTKKKTKKFS